jgi:hypothetical protein
MGFPMHTAHQLCPFGSSTGASGGLLARIFLPVYMACSLLTQSGGLIKVKVVWRRHLAAFRAEKSASAAEGLRSEADHFLTPLRDKSLPRLQSLLLALGLLHIA